MTVFTKDIQTEPLPSKPVKLPPPCPICGERERVVAPGVYVIFHNYESHGISVPASNRMTTERLVNLPDATAFDRLGDRREA